MQRFSRMWMRPSRPRMTRHTQGWEGRRSTTLRSPRNEARVRRARWRQRVAAAPQHLPCSVRQAVARNLANLLEAVAFDDVEEDHGSHVVAFRVPFDRPGIGDPLVPEAPECAYHVGPSREAPLGSCGSLAGPRDAPRR